MALTLTVGYVWLRIELGLGRDERFEKHKFRLVDGSGAEIYILTNHLRWPRSLPRYQWRKCVDLLS